MPKVTSGVTAAILLVLALALTGCGDDAADAGGAEDERETAALSESEPAPTEGPLVASTPSASPEDPDAEFTAYVRSELDLLPTTGIADATDGQLITAGRAACEQLRAGADSEAMRLVEGEEVAPSGYFMDTLTIVDGARRFYCPDTIY